MECIAKVRSRQFGPLGIIPVGLVDDNAVGHFHDTALDALQFIPRTSQLNQKKKVDHRMYCRLALTDPDSFRRPAIPPKDWGE